MSHAACDMTRLCAMWHTHIYDKLERDDNIRMACDMTHWYKTWLMWHDVMTHLYAMWHKHANNQSEMDNNVDMARGITHCDVTHTHAPGTDSEVRIRDRQKHWYGMGHDSLICDITRVTWLIDVWYGSLICDMTHWYVTWLIDMWHDSLICDITRVTWLIDVWHGSLKYDVTHKHTCTRHW